MTFDEWWDSTDTKATPDTYKGWEESCREAWKAGQRVEREACALACESTAEAVTYQTDSQGAADKCAAEIRARSNARVKAAAEGSPATERSEP